MFEHIITIPVPAESFVSDRIPSVIYDKVISFVMTKYDNDIDAALPILQSPAFFGICHPFPIKEYLKNVIDKMREKQIENKDETPEMLYLTFSIRINSDKSVDCLINDNGYGISQSFLKLDANETMMDYYKKKLITEDGNEVKNIPSSKSVTINEKGEAFVGMFKPKTGGKGLGLATVARIINRCDKPLSYIQEEDKHPFTKAYVSTTNRLLLGNIKDLPSDIQQDLHFDTTARGAAILLTAKPFEEEQLDKFQPLRSQSLLKFYEKFVNQVKDDALGLIGKSNEVNEAVTEITNDIFHPKKPIEIDSDTESDIDITEFSSPLPVSTSTEINETSPQTPFNKSSLKLSFDEDNREESPILTDSSEEKIVPTKLFLRLNFGETADNEYDDISMPTEEDMLNANLLASNESKEILAVESSGQSGIATNYFESRPLDTISQDISRQVDEVDNLSLDSNQIISPTKPSTP